MALGPILKVADYINKGRKFVKSPAGKKTIQTIKDKFKGKPKSLTEIAKKVENKARKDSAEASKKLRDAERKKLKESLSENKSSEATPKRSYEQGFSKPKRSYKQGFSKGGIVDRQYLKGR